MINFVYNSPTKVVFGKETELETGRLVKEAGGKKVLLHYGGGSAERSGLLGRVREALSAEGIEFIELGGVVPNPQLGLIYKGIELCKKEGVDFLLAVGGGSVIDSAKGIAYGAANEGDVWDLYLHRRKPTACLPLGCVLTIAAAGSETSNATVVTNEKTREKRAIRIDLCRPRFAVMNPELTLSLPAEQTAYGVADVLMHTMERYFTPEEPMHLTKGLAESLLRTVMESGSRLTREPGNYGARAEVMWAGSLSHNDLMGCGGGPGDWATHQMGHELSAKYGIAHGASLTCLWGSWARYVYKDWLARFVDFALHVMEVEPAGSDEETALHGIEAMEEYFWSLELPTNLSEAGLHPSAEDLEDLAERCTYYGERTVGGLKALGKGEILSIYERAL